MTHQQRLEAQYGRDWLDMKELAIEMGIQHKSVLNAISRGDFPIDTYKVGLSRRRRVLVAAVASFLTNLDYQ